MKDGNKGMQSKKFVLQDVRVKPLNTHGPNPSLESCSLLSTMGVASTDANQQTDSNLSFRRSLVTSVSYSNERKMGISMTQQIWCKDSELAPNQVASELEATSPQQHCTEPGANTTLVTETCLCLLIMLLECILSHFLHALLSSLSEISFHFQTGLPPVIAPSENLPELSWPAFVLTWARLVL